jgi:hypothetical protein
MDYFCRAFGPAKIIQAIESLSQGRESWWIKILFEQ